LSFEDCKTTVICYSLNSSGSCSVGFSLFNDGQDLAVETVNESLNLSFDLLLTNSMEYQVYANVTLNDISFWLRRTFHTGNCKYFYAQLRSCHGSHVTCSSSLTSSIIILFFFYLVDPRLTPVNVGLIVSGAIMLVAALVADVFFLVLVVQCKRSEGKVH
jgi:hypothetical protein